MRTTLDIADDVLQAAKDRAAREKKTIREVISELARSALITQAAPTFTGSKDRVHGFRPFSQRGSVITNERIDTLREDDA